LFVSHSGEALLPVHFCTVFTKLFNIANISRERPITILLEEERRLVREAWRMVLEKEARFKVIAECSDCESALEKAKELHPDIIILDIVPPGLGGVEMIPLFRKFSPGSKILIVSHYTFPDIARKLLQAGASGYLTKTSPLEEMFESIFRVRKGEKYLCREVSNTIREQADESDDPKIRLSRLSIRELEVITGVKNGATSKEIAEDLKIAAKTVEIHRFRILKKLQLKNSSELVDFFNRHQAQF
jgi:DNA-binding NarL/FixJ family response regulator